MFNFLKNHQIFPQQLHHFTSYQQCMRVPVSSDPQQYLLFFFFLIAILVGRKCYLIMVFFFFLMIVLKYDVFVVVKNV